MQSIENFTIYSFPTKHTASFFISENYTILSEYIIKVFSSFTYMVSSTVNSISMIYHSCKRRKYDITMFRKYCIIFLFYEPKQYNIQLKLQNDLSYIHCYIQKYIAIQVCIMCVLKDFFKWHFLQTFNNSKVCMQVIQRYVCRSHNL